MKKLIALVMSAALVAPFANQVNAEENPKLVINSIKNPDGGIVFYDSKWYVLSRVYNNLDVPVKLTSVNVEAKLKPTDSNQYRNISFTADSETDKYYLNTVIKPHTFLDMAIDAVGVEEFFFDNFTVTKNKFEFLPLNLYIIKTGKQYKILSYNAKNKTYKLSDGKGKTYTVNAKDVSNQKPKKK